MTSTNSDKHVTSFIIVGTISGLLSALIFVVLLYLNVITTDQGGVGILAAMIGLFLHRGLYPDFWKKRGVP